MNEQNFLEELQMILEENQIDNEDLDVKTFEEAMLMTRNKGLVVKVGELEFQLTIIQSK